MEEKHIKLSRFLSLLLRHKPEQVGLRLDDYGYLYVDELIEGINSSGRVIDKYILNEIVYTDSKSRYSFNDDKTKIRATQGHSLSVDLGLQKTAPPRHLYHGTADRFFGSIKKQGILKMGREHVHLSETIETAGSVGGRRGNPVIIIVESKKMNDDGFDFYLSENKVWLTEKVPPEYIKIKID